MGMLMTRIHIVCAGQCEGGTLTDELEQTDSLLGHLSHAAQYDSVEHNISYPILSYPSVA